MDIQLRNAKHAVAVTPSDTEDLARTAHKGLYVGTTGNISVEMLGGGTALFSSVPVGILPIAVTRVNSTDTTATNIVALA
jgi:hypothetical protein